MQRTFFAICILTAFVLVAIFVWNNIPQKPTWNYNAEVLWQDGDTTYFQPENKAFTLVVFEKPQLQLKFVKQNVTTLHEQASENGWTSVVNGGYFFGNYVDARPVGLLQIKDQKISSLVNDSQKQATHVMIWNDATQNLTFTSTSEIEVSDYAGSQFSLLQAGPLFVRDNVIQSKAIKDSLNGSGSYLRASIGFTKDDRVFFAISRYAVTLQEFAQFLKESAPLRDTTITVLNLDGGSSTALFTSRIPDLSFGENKRLPVMIGMKQ